MPPKEVRSKAATKKPAATTKMTLPASRPQMNFSIDSTDKFAVAYCCKGIEDYADMVIHVNGVVQVSECRVSIAEDGNVCLVAALHSVGVLYRGDPVGHHGEYLFPHQPFCHCL